MAGVGRFDVFLVSLELKHGSEIRKANPAVGGQRLVRRLGPLDGEAVQRVVDTLAEMFTP